MHQGQPINYDDDDKIYDTDNDDYGDDDDDDDNNDGNVFFVFINIFFVIILYLKLHYSDKRWFQTFVPLFHVMGKVGLLILKLVLNLSFHHKPFVARKNV